MAKNKSIEKFKELLNNLMFKLGLKKRKPIKYTGAQINQKKYLKKENWNFMNHTAKTLM